MLRDDLRIRLQQMRDHAQEAIELAGMRDRLILGCDQVDLNVLWQIVTCDLPPVVEELDRALSEGL